MRAIGVDSTAFVSVCTNRLEMQRFMFCRTFKQHETDVFRLLNQVIEPLVRSGYGSPGLLTIGLTLLETTGRKTGRSYSVPVVAKRWGDLLVVGTARRETQWIKNLAAHPRIQVWISGRAQTATAYVLGANSSAAALPSTLTPIDQLLVRGLTLLNRLYGVQWAIIIPQDVIAAETAFV